MIKGHSTLRGAVTHRLRTATLNQSYFWSGFKLFCVSIILDLHKVCKDGMIWSGQKNQIKENTHNYMQCKEKSYCVYLPAYNIRME